MHTKEDIHSNTIMGNTINVLHEIHRTEKNIAIYQRDTFLIQKELSLTKLNNIKFKASGKSEEILELLKSYFKANLLSCNNLFEDISNLFKEFENITQATSFSLLLNTVNSNLCKRFHTDINDLRLLCTYKGQGTLWLPNKAVNRQAFLSQEGNEQIIKDKKQIQQVDTGDVIIMKGALYPNASAAVHQSPSIEENGESRLVLRLDTNDFLNFV